jgi:hypothetical protein
MSQDNVELLRRGYDIWRNDGLDAALREFLDPEVELHDVVEMPGASVYRGHEGAREMWATWMEAWDEFRFWPVAIEALNADQVLAEIRIVGRGQGSAATVEVPIYEVWTVRDGRGVKRVAAFDRDKALAAAGLSARRI